MNQTLLDKLSKITQGVISGRFKIKPILVINKKREENYFYDDQRHNYIVSLPHNLELEVGIYEQELFLQTEIVGDFHWFRRWLNEYKHPVRTMYFATLAEKGKFIDKTDTKEEIQNRKQLADLYKWCENKRTVNEDAAKKKHEREKQLRESKERKRIEKFLRSI
jgi:hypothetical protein